MTRPLLPYRAAARVATPGVATPVAGMRGPARRRPA
ncbi:hypothetical protein DM39_4291 [Burkholderia cenocepacia]|uniref:Uncharacterized protein n=1 Tax=Burkholderia cenocepacia TaxID=95486 RepID=A0AAN0VNZ4_9BURK|nr:hypothetical protein DM39_4291 [Burkholderia cenocepacia]